MLYRASQQANAQEGEEEWSILADARPVKRFRGPDQARARAGERHEDTSENGTSLCHTCCSYNFTYSASWLQIFFPESRSPRSPASTMG